MIHDIGISPFYEKASNNDIDYETVTYYDISIKYHDINIIPY